MRMFAVSLIILISLAGILWMILDEPDQVDANNTTASNIPIEGRPEYAGSEACRKCHEKQFETWHHSYHRTMTQWPDSKTVVGDFNDLKLEAFGRKYHFTNDGDHFFVEMPDPETDAAAMRMGMNPNDIVPPARKMQVVMTTGSHHLQTYWVSAGQSDQVGKANGEDEEPATLKKSDSATQTNLLHQVPWVFHIDEQRWIPNEDSFVAPPTDQRQLFLNWNTSCIRCHAVAGKPNQTVSGWKTQVAEIGISCEACHGPGQSHVEFHSSEKTQKGPAVDEGSRIGLFHPGKVAATVSAQTCGQCHADVLFKSGHQLGEFRPGDNFNKSFALNSNDRQRFWKDGSMRVAGREYIPISRSKCFSGGEFSCLSCHSMHDYKDRDHQLRRAASNDSCLQCHEAMRDNIAEHTHHDLNSAGSQCVNCHMPFTTYALFQATRSHRIDIPSADKTARLKRPNACNQCHAGRTLAWTANRLGEWYGHEIPVLSKLQEEIPATVLELIQGDGAARTIAAWNLSRKDSRSIAGDGWQLPFLVDALEDDYASVRLVAYRSLKTFDLFSDWQLTQKHGSVLPTESKAARIRLNETKLGDIPPALQQLFDGKSLNVQLVERLKSGRDETPVLLTE